MSQHTYRKEFSTFQVALPSLQSPKNAVAPSDIVFNRPAANPISTGEFFTGVQSLHVKNNSSVLSECSNTSHSNCDVKVDKKTLESSVSEEKRKVTGVVSVNDPINKELRLIDELSTSMGPSTSKIPQSLTTCLVDSMVRSCSVGEWINSKIYYYIQLVKLNKETIDSNTSNSNTKFQILEYRMTWIYSEVFQIVWQSE